MLKKVKLALSLIDTRSRFLVIFFACFRVLMAGLDTLGVILIGLLLSKSANFLLTNSEANNADFFNLPSIVNRLSIPQIASLSLTFFIAKSALSVIVTKFMADVLAEAESKSASALYTKLLSQKFNRFTDISSQDLIFSLNNSAASAISGTLTTSVSILSEFTLLMAICIIFFTVNFQIAAGIIIFFTLIGYSIYKVIGPQMQKLGERFSQSARGSSKSLNDSVIAYREILTLHKQDEFISKFTKGRISFAKSNAYTTFYTTLPRYIIESAVLLGAVILSVYVFDKNDASNAVGILGIFLTGSLRMMSSLLPLQTSINSLRHLLAQSEPFLALIEETKNIANHHELMENKKNFESNPVSIILENVSFTYPNANSPAVRNISLEISSGELIALVGPSGAGKSTIADLLINLIKPSSGTVSYKNVHSKILNIGYVPQSPGIVTGTILDNITLNVDSKEFDPLKLEIALEKSHLKDLIKSLEIGLQTDLGAQTDALSGGQLQRIGLARALYNQPGLLILDEATSALDAETESAITESLSKLKGSCTIVVIAHRLSTVQNADRVYVIEDGQIAASGKFSELAKTNELVARYVELSKLNVD